MTCPPGAIVGLTGVCWAAAWHWRQPELQNWQHLRKLLPSRSLLARLARPQGMHSKEPRANRWAHWMQSAWPQIRFLSSVRCQSRSGLGLSWTNSQHNSRAADVVGKSDGSFERNLPGPFPPLTPRGWSLVTATAAACTGIIAAVLTLDARGAVGQVLFISASIGLLFVYLALWREAMVRLIHALRHSTLGETMKMAIFVLVLVAIPALTFAALLLVAS